MKKANQDNVNDTDYRGIASLVKWGAIGFVIVAGVGGGTYFLVKKSISNSKEDKQYSNTIAVDKKGKATSSIVGTGKTPAAYATAINAALTATTWGVPDTDEDTIYKLLKELKTQYEVAQVSTAFEGLYQKPLAKGLEAELDNDEMQEALNIITSKPLGGKSK